MLNKKLLSTLFGFFGLLSSAQAASVSMVEIALYIDGTVTSFSSPGDVACVGCAVSLDSSGLGSIAFNSLAAGSHKIGAMIDYEIDEATNTFFNEYGEASGVPTAGLSWEIDEPGYVFGNIYDNFLLGALDNLNSVPVGSPDDVSMALMWDFAVLPTEIATLVFNISPSSGSSFFSLIHRDLDVSDSVFFSSSLDIKIDSNPPVTEVPEPSVLLLLSAGLGMMGLRRSNLFQKVN